MPRNPELGRELAPPTGKDDAIQNPILDNPEADKAFRDSAIRRARHGGMAPALAQQLYGDQ